MRSAAGGFSARAPNPFCTDSKLPVAPTTVNQSLTGWERFDRENSLFFACIRLSSCERKQKRARDLIMTKEGCLCKLKPRDWPGFLRRVIAAAVWQALPGQVAGSGDPRLRWTPKYVLLCWIAMGWSVQRHLKDHFREGWQLWAALFVRRRPPGARIPVWSKPRTAWGSTSFSGSRPACGVKCRSGCGRCRAGTAGQRTGQPLRCRLCCTTATTSRCNSGGSWACSLSPTVLF